MRRSKKSKLDYPGAFFPGNLGDCCRCHIPGSDCFFGRSINGGAAKMRPYHTTCLDALRRVALRGEPLYDVVAVNIKTKQVRLLTDEGKTLPNAEAIVNMAVMRRGVETEFYAEVPAGAYKDEDRWQGKYKKGNQVK